MMFSIVTALRDGFPDFGKTIPTVLGQTRTDFEWLIVDDGSKEPLSAFFPDLGKDPRVRIFREEKSKGQTVCLNQAIRESQGEWIVRMDGDDLCLNDRLEQIEQCVRQNPGAEIVYSDYEVIDEEGRIWAQIRYRQKNKGFFRYLEHTNNPICHPTVAFRRLSMGKLRVYREDLKNAQDYALWKEILHTQGPDSFVHIPAVTVRYRIVRNSLSGALAREQRKELAAIREGAEMQPVDRAALTLNERQKEEIGRAHV